MTAIGSTSSSLPLDPSTADTTAGTDAVTPEETVEAAASPLEPDIAEVGAPAPTQSAPAALPPGGSVPVVLHDVARRMFDVDHPSRQLLRSSLISRRLVPFLATRGVQSPTWCTWSQLRGW